MRKPQLKWRNLFLGLGFFGCLFLLGAAFLYLEFIAPQRAVDAAQNWAETPCEILQSHVSEDGSRPSYVYSFYIQFKYTFHGQEYVSDRFDFSEVQDRDGDWIRETVAGLPPGTNTVCFVNPDDPSQAVMRRGFGPIGGDSSTRYLGLIVPVGLIVFGLIGMGFTLISCLADPLDRAFDKMLQLLDPEYEPYRGENGESANDGGERTAMIPSDRVRELLCAHGEVRSQDASDWNGAIPLPEDIAMFYRDVGPIDITIEGCAGSSTLIPSLSHLWDSQAAVRGTSTNELWNRIVNKLFHRWDSDWIVVAIDGADLLIYSVRDAKILSALYRRGAWEPYEVYPNLNAMAACVAILGSVAVDAGDDLTDDDSSIRPKYRAQAMSWLTEELGNETDAEAAFGAAGWGEPPRSTHT